MKFNEFDTAELARLMIEASKVDSDIKDIEPDEMTDEEREALHDARYYAHKLYRLLLMLAKAARDAEAQGEDD